MYQVLLGDFANILCGKYYHKLYCQSHVCRLNFLAFQNLLLWTESSKQFLRQTLHALDKQHSLTPTGHKVGPGVGGQGYPGKSPLRSMDFRFNSSDFSFQLVKNRSTEIALCNSGWKLSIAIFLFFLPGQCLATVGHWSQAPSGRTLGARLSSSGPWSCMSRWRGMWRGWWNEQQPWYTVRSTCRWMLFSKWQMYLLRRSVPGLCDILHLIFNYFFFNFGSLSTPVRPLVEVIERARRKMARLVEIQLPTLFCSDISDNHGKLSGEEIIVEHIL